ncbi:serine/threonine-protein kinase ppk11 [Histoplasma capsulatum G186AR]|uniref:non-specific serine/threonine protein kinase n=1 Tax=Ajellomyces capsulatus (strain G186AR / H82 / ATCC MYA-2454 / RMSCC 2432) TaxID=447093 RepID=C0NRH0_AJECG|nr:serine/threonine-protein kinase ppk11 [Histoplasma capsulatum G186AR]EEH06284.1 serine/threonine-protein kinase ppk11 [Histoplasma capsulatum G186AR]
MPRPCPHPLALFSLVPLENRARAALDHPDNSHLVSTFNDENGNQVAGIDIGFHIGSTSRYTLATLGRSGADVTVEGSSISRIQCSFELNPDSHVVMLYDRSNSQTTQVFGEDAIPFETGRIRRIAVEPRLNTRFGIGGVRSDLVQFELQWHRRTFDVEEQVNNQVDNPRLTRTVDDIPTVLPSQRLTRIHTPGNRLLNIRYMEMNQLGAGTISEVWKAVDADSGNILALKLFKEPPPGFSEQMLPHIVEYIHHQEVGGQLEIFMPLKEGSLQTLMLRDHFKENFSLANALLRQMLQALDYLAFFGIIHRDVKPANILYTSLSENQCCFQLADFGVCNSITNARTCVGSPIYMAPEVLEDKGIAQSSKVDVWSLFVTLAYALDVNGYRNKALATRDQKVEAALEAAETQELRSLKDMVAIDPKHRASAAQMLLKFYDGEGLTTPRNQIEGIFASDQSFNAHTDTPTLTREALDAGRQRTRRSLTPIGPAARLRHKPAAAALLRQQRGASRVRKPGAQSRPVRQLTTSRMPSKQSDQLQVPGMLPGGG